MFGADDEIREGRDLVTAMAADHGRLRRLLVVCDTDGPPDATHFWLLADGLVRHELAEEIVVYPLVDAGSDGSVWWRVGLGEQLSFEAQLSQLEVTTVAGPEYRRRWRQLASGVREHLGWEESLLFPRLEAAITAEGRRRLLVEYRRVRDTAPSHRSSGALGATIVGRVRALSTWIRDSSRSITTQR